uniref:Uncharacterized protein n=1 Tax=Apteryx owenii TaxID=8824 RepID=A0A8B9QKI3_APTOW
MSDGGLECSQERVCKACSARALQSLMVPHHRLSPVWAVHGLLICTGGKSHFLLFRMHRGEKALRGQADQWVTVLSCGPVWLGLEG